MYKTSNKLWYNWYDNPPTNHIDKDGNKYESGRSLSTPRPPKGGAFSFVIHDVVRRDKS